MYQIFNSQYTPPYGSIFEYLGEDLTELWRDSTVLVKVKIDVIGR